VIRVTGPRTVAFWGGLCLVLLIFCAAGHESSVDLSLWGCTVFILWTTALAAYLANRRAPVHRGSFAWPTSSSTSLLLALSLLFAALTGAFGLWFGVLVPVPAVIAAYGAIRDRKLNERMVTAGVVDPKAPPYLAGAGKPREIPAWPEPDSDRG
jgi:hypothetical protein